MNFRLRPWQDADAFVAAELASPNISRFMSDAFPGNDVEKWEKFIRNANENPSAFYRVIEVDGKFAGSIGVLIHNDILRMNAELGYWIGDRYKCRGIMTEAVKEIVKLVFDKFEVARIYAHSFRKQLCFATCTRKSRFSLEAMFERIYIKNGNTA
jgi:RimJ/RimL family protein N-acetyltransferase